ncbi:uncharacterized protein [Haliotis asinina]|uniref:uncharacterized protein n=1 Tax=Haliotis asinina TaxID=109174 RepID=UPI0035318359
MGKAFTKQVTLPHVRPSTSRPAYEVMYEHSGGSSSFACDCLVYGLQPHCTENRHFHTAIGKFGELIVRDLSHKRKWIINTTIDKKCLIPKKVMKGTGLIHCTVIGFSKGIAVVQCFFQRAVNFFICDINKQNVLCKFERRYQGQEKLHLFECCMSIDLQYIVLKKNPLYQLECFLEYEKHDFILLKMSEDFSSCKEVPLPEMSFEKMSVIFDPAVPTKSLIVARMNTCGPKLYRIILEDCTTSVTEDIALGCAAAQDKFSVLQNVHDQRLIILSVLGDSANIPLRAVCKNFSVTNYIYDLNLQFKGQFSYISSSGLHHFAPVFSPSGQFLSCAQEVLSLVSSFRLKTLKEMCRASLLELVLSEDMLKLPLPPSLVRYIQGFEGASHIQQ